MRVMGVVMVSLSCALPSCISAEPPLRLSDTEVCKAYVQHMVDGERSKFSRQIEQAVTKRGLDCKSSIKVGM